MAKKSTDETKVSYEEAIARLEEAVRSLEKGDLTLEDSLVKFEEGIKWSRLCEQKLTEAKGKVEMLVKKAGGDIGVENFDSTEM